MKMGRPTLYKPEYCEQASRACMLGLTNEQLAKMFGISIKTIEKWIKEKPEFIGAIKKGRIIADQDVAISLYKRATGYSHKDVDIKAIKGKIVITNLIKYYPPDTAAAFIWLKNRRPDLWRDRIDIAPTDPNDAARKMREQTQAMRIKTNGITPKVDTV